MYPLVSTISFVARFYLCYITIEQLPVFSNDALGWVFGQILSIYTLFRLICYPIVGLISSHLEVQSAALRSAMYFILYLPLVGIYWLILSLLTNIFGVLPIS